MSSDMLGVDASPEDTELFLREATVAEQAVRAQTVHARPMPSTGHNIAFALSEMAGEVIDAIMRGYPEYVRNNGKAVDLELEIGDTFSQIVSALITLEGDAPDSSRVADETQSLAAMVCANLASAQNMWQIGSKRQTQSRLYVATRWLLALCQHLGVEPERALLRSHEKTLRKHAARIEQVQERNRWTSKRRS